MTTTTPENSRDKVILTGVKPTGAPHIGNLIYNGRYCIMLAALRHDR